MAVEVSNGFSAVIPKNVYIEDNIKIELRYNNIVCMYLMRPVFVSQ